ncbi:type II secretion system protein [Gracilibacillus oryzae]|uniref:Type II secretion system protein n=1 Tax=Gracilibacillus oryzae TaxID=1672701 RepID=A0A7C8KSJ5_9BACI|nr:competence type IV pilus minor pilin ComGD [Gracilibacillus oryzae]KAB8128447.1 type II secretion system protein [Gracilibacillus oryzae]
MFSAKGFTLIEVLLVLSLAGILFIVGQGFTLQSLDRKQFQQFYEEFNLDLLYLQQLNISSKSAYTLNFDPIVSKYHIRSSGRGNVVFTRDYPDEWVIEPNTLKLPIKYSKNGTLKNPGTLRIETKYRTYFITCSFGKGRCYSEEK